MGFADDDEQDDVTERPLSEPPEDRLPGIVSFEIVLNQSDDVAVLLTGMRVFPSGVAMVLGVRLRRRVRGMDMNVFDDVFDHRRFDEPADPAWQRGRLRWGFVFDDGSEVDNLDTTPSGIHLHGGGGGGNEQSCDRDYWLSSLPPSGSLDAFCEWTKAGLPRRTQSLDAGSIVQAAARSRRLWT